MATFYIQLENKLLQISGELTTENISKALGYVPVSPNVTNELSQRVDNITFDSLKDNPFLQDGSGELKIVDDAGNIIAKIDAEGIHSVDFIAGEHRLSNKTDKTYVDEAIKNVEVDLTGYATEEYVNNIDFYNINNNPIVDGEENSLTLVDENGNIGLKISENGLYVKDVIADGHTLSQKADKSDIPSLDGYATESYVNTNLQNYATKDEVSDLVDMSVVTELQGKVEMLVGEDTDKSVRDIAVDVLTETLVSETATEAYDTLAEMSAWIKSHPEDAAAMNTAIQKNATDIQSNTTAISNLDAAYKAADTKVLTDAQEYTDNINFYTIKDNPIVDNNDGNLTFVDETGNIGLKVTEDGIITKDVVTPEHTLSNKADKSELPTKVSELENDKGYIVEHQDISHLVTKDELSTSVDELNAILVDTDAEADDPIIPDYVTETELNTALSNKMDKVTLAKVATSGSYNDLSNKPTIPTAVTESTVSGWGFTKNTGTYSKPSGGIPKTDLASAVQTSLGKADTALQSYTEQYKGTVTGVKINGTTKNPSSGVVDLGTVITAHQDISGKQDKLVSGTNIKTINGTSILGSGNITISGGSGGSSSGSGVYSEVNHGTSDTTFTLTPNTFHVWDDVTSLTLDLGSETSGVANEYLFQFTSGSESTTLSLPDDIKWANDTAPTIAENMIYQVSILKGLASVLEFDNAPSVVENKVTVSISGTKYLVSLQYAAASNIVVNVWTLDGIISVDILSGETSKSASPKGPMIDSNSYIESITPAVDTTYNYIF